MRLLVVLVLLASPALADDPTLAGVDDFLYWIDGPRPDEVAGTEFDLVVVDASADGSEARRFTREEVARMQRTRSGRRRAVLAYLSIGEAESYRGYWNPAWDAGAPAWLGPLNPDWPGNYKVRYWDPAWRAILMEGPGSALGRIVEAGFDGVYLDIVDAYYYWGEEAPEADRIPLRQAAGRMIDLVESIAREARRARPGFLVVPQNGEYVVHDVEDEARAAAWHSAIDGLGVEDVFHRAGDDSPGEDAPHRPDRDRLEVLAEYREKGETILSIEYLTKRDAIDRYHAEARRRGFVPFAGRRALDGIPPYPGPR